MTTSKETPDSAIAKTVLAPRPFAVVAAAVCLVAVLGFFLFHRTPPEVTLQIGSHTMRLERASTPAAQRQGLGGRRSLALDRGMLFVFEPGKASCFWMKNMHFPLDVIWLDGNKQITTIAANVAPNTYPQSFCPTAKSTYVIELNAGQAEALGLTTDQKLFFKS